MSVILISIFLTMFFLFVLLIFASFTFAGECRQNTRIAEIEIAGLKHTHTHVITRELLHKKGDLFKIEVFEREKAKLQDLDLFTDIKISCNENNPTKITYHFQEIFRWIPSPAGKKTDRDGLMVGLALANLNVLGEDIRVELQYRTAIDPFFENNEYALYASSPYFLGLPIGFNFEFLRTDSWDDLRKFNDKSFLADLDLNFKLKENFALLFSGAYRFLQGGYGHLPEFGLGFSLDFRESELDTRQGSYLEWMLTHTGIGKSEDFFEILLDGRTYFSLARFVTGATALARYRTGRVAFYDYYYHGGANTFRGHASNSLHLGVHEILLNLEERFIVLERRSASLWGIHFFYGLQLVAGLDGSLLWEETLPTWRDYEGAVYGGVHLIIPALERIRFEIGFSPDKGEPVFYFGLFDKTTSARWRSR